MPRRAQRGAQGAGDRAQGALGRLCVEPLRRAGFEVIHAGRKPEKADDFRLVDLGQPDSVPEACADADLVISMVNDRSRTAERFVLREGGTMFTAIISPADRAAVKALGDRANGLVVTDIGLGPASPHSSSRICSPLIPTRTAWKTQACSQCASRQAEAPSKTSPIRY